MELPSCCVGRVKRESTSSVSTAHAKECKLGCRLRVNLIFTAVRVRLLASVLARAEFEGLPRT